MRTKIQIAQDVIAPWDQMALLEKLPEAMRAQPDVTLSLLQAMAEARSHDKLIASAEAFLKRSDLGDNQRALARSYLATSLFEIGEFGPARAIAEEALQHNPKHGSLRRLIARVIGETGDLDQALDYCETALKDLPDAEALFAAMVRFARIAHQQERAFRMARRLNGMGVHNGAVLTSLIEDGLMIGDASSTALAHAAMNLVAHLRREDHDDLQSVDPAAVFRAIVECPAATEQPRGKAAKHSLKLSPLDRTITARLALVFTAAEDLINRTVSAAKTDQSMADLLDVMGPQPKATRLDVWATLYGGAGFQKPHFHLSWFSCVYFPSDESGTAGDLSFGFRKSGDAALTKTVPPAPGTLVAFPSFMPHWTVPANEGANRVSVAFDLYPER